MYSSYLKRLCLRKIVAVCNYTRVEALGNVAIRLLQELSDEQYS